MAESPWHPICVMMARALKLDLPDDPEEWRDDSAVIAEAVILEQRVKRVREAERNVRPNS